MTATAATSRTTAAHYLNRAGFGPRPGDIDRLCDAGAAEFVEEQLSANLPDVRTKTYIDGMETIRYSLAEIVIRHQRDGQSPASIECVLEDLRSAKLFRAIESANQLAEVMTDLSPDATAPPIVPDVMKEGTPVVPSALQIARSPE